MSKAARIKTDRLQSQATVLEAQMEGLIRDLALERTNTQRMNLVMACLVKRLGEKAPDDSKWMVLVTDEEIERMSGELAVHRSTPAMSLVLTLHRDQCPKCKSYQDFPGNCAECVANMKAQAEAEAAAEAEVLDGVVGEDQGERDRPAAEEEVRTASEDQAPVAETA